MIDKALLLSRALSLLVLSGLGLWIADRRWGFVRKFLSEERSPRDLAIARIVIFATLLYHIRLRYTLEFARLNPILQVPPAGWQHLIGLVPRQEMLVRFCFYLFVLTSAAAILGLYTRIAAGASTILAFYLFTITQIFGKIDHVHHLILLGAVLALSRSGDVLSLDSIRRPAHPALGRARQYALPLNGMALILGLCYYFPGVWKLSRLGAAWFTASNMRMLITMKLAELTPSGFQLWFIRQPTLLFLGSVFTIIFELGFVFAVMNPKSRLIALVSGLAFHNAISLIMGIPFGGMQLSYVVLVDSGWVLSAFRAHTHADVPGASHRTGKQEISSWSPVALALYAIIGGMILAGIARRVNGWPFACYPTFDSSNPLVTQVELDLKDRNGHVWHTNLSCEARLERIYSPERWTALVETATYGALAQSRADALVKIWKTQEGISEPLTVDVYRAIHDFSQPHDAVVSRTLLYSLQE